MPTKRTKRVRKLAVPTNPKKTLSKLYPPDEDEDDDRVAVNACSISIDGETVSSFESLEDMHGCCGVTIIEGLDNIAPDKKEADAAVHALYLDNDCFGTNEITFATTNDDDSQLSAADFFRANGWKEIPLGRSSNSGNQLTLWILRRN